MISIITFLDKALSLIHLILAKLKVKKAQDERDALENDPYLWFDSHFNGVPESARQKRNPNEANTKDSA